MKLSIIEQQPYFKPPDNVDDSLRLLYDISVKSPVQCCRIPPRSEGHKVDSSTIPSTITFNSSSIPSERLVLAKKTLEDCKAALETDIERDFMEYYHGAKDIDDSGIINYLHALTSYDTTLIDAVLFAYRVKKEAPMQELADSLKLDIRKVQNQAYRARNQIKTLHGAIKYNATIENLLKESGYLFDTVSNLSYNSP